MPNVLTNVLTNLAADLYKSADMVGREVTGFIPSVTINRDGSETIALNGTVRSFATRKVAATDTNVAMTFNEGAAQTVDNKTLTLDKSKEVIIPWTGEDVRHADGGAGYRRIVADQVTQAMRTIRNLVEVDVAVEAYKNSSRAVGTAGTVPFASNLNDVAIARQQILENGQPVDDGLNSLILNPSAGTNLRNLANLQKVNESGGTELLRQGVLLPLQGVMLRESLQVQDHTKGTGAGRLVNGAFAVGATVIAVDGGAGTILAGDVITFAGDTNKYVVVSALAGGSITIGDPGLKVALADNATITGGSNYTGNILLHQGAMELAVRAPAIPDGGDGASDRMVVQDPYSGLTFDISVYKGQRKNTINVSSVWGVKAWNTDAIITLMG